jgi:hypothetical protein
MEDRYSLIFRSIPQAVLFESHFNKLNASSYDTRFEFCVFMR